jgi:hypothetical protein
MASFAKIGMNGIVLEVVSVSNEIIKDDAGNEQEALGINFLEELSNWPCWKQTSYNTHGGVHQLGGTPLRKNYAGIGFKYDDDRNAFIPPRPYLSWTLNETNCQWEPPVAEPTEGHHTWNEETQQWDVDS